MLASSSRLAVLLIIRALHVRCNMLIVMVDLVVDVCVAGDLLCCCFALWPEDANAAAAVDYLKAALRNMPAWRGVVVLNPSYLIRRT